MKTYRRASRSSSNGFRWLQMVDKAAGSFNSGSAWAVPVLTVARLSKNGQENKFQTHETIYYIKKENKTEDCFDIIQYKQRTVKVPPMKDEFVKPTESIFSNKEAEINDPLSRSGTFEPIVNNMTQSILSALAPALFMAQCLSLLGVSDVACENGSKPVFRWKSPRMLFSIVVSSLIAMRVILILLFYLSRHGVTLYGIQVFSFYMSSFLTSCLFMRLAIRWTSLCAAFESLEKRLTSYGNSCGLKRRMVHISAAVLSSALVEKILYEFSNVMRLKTVYKSDKYERDWLQIYYYNNYESMAAYVPYGPVSIVGVMLINVASKLITTYNDLFIMLISVALSSMFRILNDGLIASAHEDKDARSWSHARATYNDICLLVRSVDRSLSFHILLSFAVNFVIVGLQLLHALSADDCTCLHEHIYLTYSFGLLALRAVGVCLFAASVYEESQAIRRVLFSVSSKSYCMEVERFIEQVTSDEITLTGGKFFNVTRSFLLRVIGTTTSYGVILVQINGLHSKSKHSP